MNAVLAHKFGIRADDIEILTEDRYGHSESDWVIYDTVIDRNVAKGTLFDCIAFKTQLLSLQT